MDRNVCTLCKTIFTLHEPFLHNILSVFLVTKTTCYFLYDWVLQFKNVNNIYYIHNIMSLKFNCITTNFILHIENTGTVQYDEKQLNRETFKRTLQL